MGKIATGFPPKLTFSPNTAGVSPVSAKKCKKLDKISVPSTLLEVYHMVPPRVFASSKNMPLAVAYDEKLDLYWRGSVGLLTA